MIFNTYSLRRVLQQRPHQSHSIQLVNCLQRLFILSTFSQSNAEKGICISVQIFIVKWKQITNLTLTNRSGWFVPISLIKGGRPCSFLINSLFAFCLAAAAKAPTTLVKTEILSGLNCKSSKASEFSCSNLISVGTMPKSMSLSTFSASEATFQRAPVTAAKSFLFTGLSGSLISSTKGSRPPWILVSWKKTEF